MSKKIIQVSSTLLPQEVRLEFEKLAEEQDRTLSYLLRQAAISYLESLGRLPGGTFRQTKNFEIPGGNQ